MFQDYPELMSIEDISKALKIGKNKTYDLLRSDSIKGIKINNSWMAPRINVENYIRENCGLPKREDNI